VTASYLESIASGDQDAIGPCMKKYGGLVSSLARRFLPPAEIEDAVQEIFIELWKNADRYTPEKAAESTFIAMIARRRLIDRVRKNFIAMIARRRLIDRVRKNARRPRHQTMETTFGLGAEDEDIRSDMGEDMRRARAAMSELSEQQKLVIRLSLTEGKSHQEIADATGMALGSVKTHLRRGMIRLRDLIASQSTSEGVIS